MSHVALVLALIIIVGAGIALTSTTSYTNALAVYYSPDTLHGGSIPQANGTTTETINLVKVGISPDEVSNRRLNTEVRLEVERGTVFLELLDNKGQPTTSVVSTSGKPVLVRGDWFADASGVMKYRIIATEAQNINYWFTVSHREGWSSKKIY